MLRWKRLEVSGGFLLLATALYYLDSADVVPWALLACALHELGHILAIYLLGGQVALLRLTCVGAELRLSARRPLSPGRELLAALAGPAASLLAAGLTARLSGGAGETACLFAGLNLALGLFNLLPAAQLDGGRILKNLLLMLGAGPRTEWVLQGISLALAALLSAAGCLLLLRGAVNVTLPITALWLLFSSPAGTVPPPVRPVFRKKTARPFSGT